MSLYLSVFRIRFLAMLQYRTAAVAGIFCQFFFGFVFIMVMEAFIRQRPTMSPMSVEQTVSYIWLGQAFLALAAWSGEMETIEDIRTGGVAYLLCRPVDLYQLWYTRLVANKTAAALLRFPLVLLLAYFLPEPYHLYPPASWGALAAFLVSMVGLVLLSCAISNLINVLNLWTVAGQGAVRLIPAVVMIFSGMIIPLAFFPDWAQPFLRFLPFSGTGDVPFRLYTGNIPVQELGWCCLHQVIWTVLLIHFGRWLVSLGRQRLVVQGG